MKKKQGKFSQNPVDRKHAVETLGILVLAVIVYIISSKYDLLESIVRFSGQHEDWEIDELITVAIFLAFALLFLSVRRWLELKKASARLRTQNRQLEKALSEIKSLRGILPICAGCKRIRDDAGYWQQVEQYVQEHSEAEFSHSICPDCMKKLYPGYQIDEEPQKP